MTSARHATQNSDLRVGIIGCGFAATALHLPALRALGGVRVVAAADIDRERLAQPAARFGIERTTTDWRSLLDERLDVIAVCVPPAYHAEVTIAALEAGKHVLVEKPVALSLDDCDRMIASAAASESIAIVGFNLRWHRLVQRARRIVAAGTVGELSLVRSAFTSTTRTEPRYAAWRAQLPGGVLVEIGSHHYDLWRFLVGSEVAEVLALTASAGGVAAVSARMSNGALASGVFSEVTGGRNELDLFGAKGQMHLSCYRFDGLEVAGIAERYPGSVATRVKRAGRLVREFAAALPATARGGDYVESYRAQWRGFLDGIRRRVPVGASLLDGKKALQVALAAAESATTGRTAPCGADPVAAVATADSGPPRR